MEWSIALRWSCGRSIGGCSTSTSFDNNRGEREGSSSVYKEREKRGRGGGRGGGGGAPMRDVRGNCNGKYTGFAFSFFRNGAKLSIVFHAVCREPKSIPDFFHIWWCCLRWRYFQVKFIRGKPSYSLHKHTKEPRVCLESIWNTVDGIQSKRQVPKKNSICQQVCVYEGREGKWVVKKFRNLSTFFANQRHLFVFL